MAPKECVFCMNTTSSLSVEKQAVATGRLDRLAGPHFPPVFIVKLVEVVKAVGASQGAADLISEHAKTLKKHLVLVIDTKRFILSHLLAPHRLEAGRLMGRAVASVEGADVATKLGCGRPMGPFALAGSIGINALEFSADAQRKEEPEHL
ncbi:short chain 3-hydroxyacyl-CoA dehydrogenase [Trypanosoma rangeli]|uniref:Short chain 3-hydroxyacyl-CoA dehydrogenase n=1 Tax=Trypanosoma rangeli TaxID=5698 RepID=A0A3R7JPN2_TRYRA|nr:short chain 3-hydroxyacyl-CoA dehydrogenase [Trypanosoma rangeli]RNE94796.1 short chain 3-hydroxyacyl-CoA dehydrogenase [Trypanosoma rangeli]|eukprot:RNE94796.1 short chain 3-hydroxyacyl-CoA dehydrogenase [Trypanosoma rangeli]